MSSPALDRSGLSLDRLKTLLAVADAGGIARAAPGDPSRQSLYSRQIGELEAALELALFERRGRGLVLTEEGRRLSALVRELRQGLDELGDLGRPRSFSIGAGDSLLHAWVIPRLAASPRFVELSTTLVALSSAEILRRVEDASLDFGLVRASEVPRGLGARKLGQLDYALYAPKAWRKRYASTTELLSRAPLALQTSEPELHTRFLARAERDPHARVLHTETFPQAQRALTSGHFAAVLPSLASGELPSTIEARELPGLAKHALSLRLVYRERAMRARRGGEALVDELAACLALG